MVYVPAPPAASKPSLPQQPDVLVIPRPAPPAAVEHTPKPDESEASSPEPKAPERRRPVQAETNGPSAATETAAPSAATAAPQLQPARSPEQQIELEKQIGDLRGAVRQQIAHLSGMALSTEDRKALQDAQLLLSQADQAMQDKDLQQSFNLAQKADLLISAVEKSH
ncbi:MAG: hypothetical protein ACRD2P_12690 [Terriglobia bacterium]